MREETKKRCQQAVELIKRGEQQKDVLQKLNLGPATLVRYKASVKPQASQTSHHPVLPHVHKAKPSLNAYKAPETGNVNNASKLDTKNLSNEKLIVQIDEIAALIELMRVKTRMLKLDMENILQTYLTN